MAILPIIWAPDPILKTTCKPVETVDDDMRRLMDDMLETMYDAPGIGLAAPQIGIDRRVVVIDVSREDDEEHPSPIVMANPRIVWSSDKSKVFEEGCLSLPDMFADVERPAEVKVEFVGRDGKLQTVDADGVLAVCVQHEIDHLDGVLFVDHISSLKRNMILRKMVKAKKTRDDKKAL